MLKKINKSFSLIEVLIAIFVLIMALLGVSILLIRTMGMVEIINSKLIAANLAQEGVELVRNIRDNNILSSRAWNAGLSSGYYVIDYNDSSLSPCSAGTGGTCKRKLNFDNSTNLYSYDIGGGHSKYSRYISIDQISSNHIRVVSIVEWKIKNINFDYKAEDHLYNFY